jgi:hypothetical protein
VWTEIVSGLPHHNRATHFAIRERVYNHPQRRQTLVDLLGFLQGLTRSASLANLLRTSQIDEVEVPVLLRAGRGIPLVNTNDEDGVRSGRLGVHVCAQREQDLQSEASRSLVQTG